MPFRTASKAIEDIGINPSMEVNESTAEALLFLTMSSPTASVVQAPVISTFISSLNQASSFHFFLEFFSFGSYFL